jgi:O-antigen/teichoic acid export membrane protein
MNRRDWSGLARRRQSSFAAQTLALAISGLAGIGIVKVITHDFGKEIFGQYATATGFVLTFALITDLGVSSSTVSALARHPDDAPAIISQNLGLRIVLGILFVPFIYGLSFVFYPHGSVVLRTLILFIAAFLPIDALRQVLAAYFAAQVKNVLTATATALQQVALFILIWIAAIGPNVESLLGLAYVGSALVGSTIVAFAARRHLRIRAAFSLKAWRRIVSSSITVGIAQVTALIYQRVDGILVSVIAGTTPAGEYALAYLVVFSVASLPGFISTAFLPAMARLSPVEAAVVATSVLRRTCLLMAGISASIIASAPEIVGVIAGGSYTQAVVPLQILVGSTVLAGCTTTLGYLTIAIDRSGSILRIQLACLALNIGANCFLIAVMGVTGAAIATVLSEAVLVTALARNLRYHGAPVPVVSVLVGPVLCAAASAAITRFALAGRLTGFELGDGALRASFAVVLFGLFVGAPIVMRRRSGFGH